VLWGGLRIAYVHLQMRRSSIFYLKHDVVINNLIAWGIPIIFATIAISTRQIGYVTSHYCGPTLEAGQALVWIPLLVYIAISSLLQIWTLFEIEEVTPFPIRGIDGRPSGNRTLRMLERITMTRMIHQRQEVLKMFPL
jgi:hypothetical protein